MARIRVEAYGVLSDTTYYAHCVMKLPSRIDNLCTMPIDKHINSTHTFSSGVIIFDAKQKRIHTLSSTLR